ncbi:retrovirus-related pol polyprotein from transposon TNT 1-94 [Tanacetum coccineum]
MEIKLTKDDEADSMDCSKYRGTKMPREYQQDYKKPRAYVPKIYNDPNMSDTLRNIYRTLESIYVHEFVFVETAHGNYKPTIKDKDGKDVVTPYRNHVRKFLRALPSKWRPKVTAIEESKDLSKLSLDELVGNLKVYEVVLEKDLEIAKNKKEKYKSLALKARQNSIEKIAKFVRTALDDKKNFRKIKEDKREDRRCFKCGDPNHFISDCPKNSSGDQKAFVVGSWSDSGDDSKKEEICLMAHSNEVLSDNLYYSSSSLDNETRKDDKAYVVINKEIMKVEESLNVKFDETPPPNSPPLVDDDLQEVDIIEYQSKDFEVKENEPLNKQISNIKESKDHPLGTVIGNLNQRTLRSQVQNQSNFFCFASFVEPKNIKEAIQDKSWTMAMQDVTPPKICRGGNMSWGVTL